MKGFVREDQMFSLCGLKCALCTMHLDHYCPGCGGGEGNQSCKIARCAMRHGGYEYCYECSQYPCGHYPKVEEYDSFITHRHRLQDMERMKEIGRDAFHDELKEKAEILQVLLTNYNDGRRKTFFCMAVNLLDLKDVHEIMNCVKTMDLDELSAKEKSAKVVYLFKIRSEQRNIELKLRRKKKE